MNRTPVLSEFPMLQTERLLLRQIAPSDAENLYGYYNDRLVTQYLDWDVFRRARQTVY